MTVIVLQPVNLWMQPLKILYSKDLSEKVIRVCLMKAGQGQLVMAFVPYGYKKEKGLVVDRETGLMVRRIFEMAAEGVPKTHIAKRLNQEGILNSVTLRKERGGRFYRKQAGKGGKSGIG